MIAVTIQSPVQCLYKGRVHAMTLTGAKQGSIQILPGHAPLLSQLVQGNVILKIQNRKETIALDKGILNFQNNEAIILVS